jgi:hypothetical protein
MFNRLAPYQQYKVVKQNPLISETVAMKHYKFAEEQIIAFLKQVDACLIS